MGSPSADFLWPVGNSGTNPSVGVNGNPIPLDSTLVGGEDPSLNLHPLQTDAGGNLKVAIATPVPLDVNLADVGGAPISEGQKTSANSIPVVIASDQSDVPTNIAEVGGAAVALGQAAMAASFPVVIASNQTDVPVNLDKVGGAVITEGQKTSANSLPVVLASDQSDLPVNLTEFGDAAVALGQTTESASIPVVIASDQSNVPTNLTQVGGSAIALGQTTEAASLPVTIASNQSNVPTNVTQFGGNNVVTGTGASGVGIPRVTVANDSTVILGAGTANIGHVDGEGTAGTPAGGVLTVQGDPAGTPIPVSGTFSLGAATAFSTSVVALTAATPTLIVTTSGSIVSVLIQNNTGGLVWFGDSSVANTGVHTGISVPDGGYFEYTNQANLYGYSVAGGNVVAMVET